jgi:hypothetical protein
MGPFYCEFRLPLYWEFYLPLYCEFSLPFPGLHLTFALTHVPIWAKARMRRSRQAAVESVEKAVIQLGTNYSIRFKNNIL